MSFRCRQRICIPFRRNELLDEILENNSKREKAKQNFVWGLMTILIFGLLWSDISNKCSCRFSIWFYFEYILMAIFGLNIISYLLKLLIYLSYNPKTICATKEQTKLFGKIIDGSTIVKPEPVICRDKNDVRLLDETFLSWYMPSQKFQLSRNYTNCGYDTSLIPGYYYKTWNTFAEEYNCLKNRSNSSSFKTKTHMQIYRKFHENDIISNEKSFLEYRKKLSKYELEHEDPRNNTVLLKKRCVPRCLDLSKIPRSMDLKCVQNSLTPINQPPPEELITPNKCSITSSKKALNNDHETAYLQYLGNGKNSYLARYSVNYFDKPLECQQHSNENESSTSPSSKSIKTPSTIQPPMYKLSPPMTPILTPNMNRNTQNAINHILQNSVVINEIPTLKLIQYVRNLKFWLTTTILKRLVAEIETIDKTLQIRGFSDRSIGDISLLRLQNIVDNQQFVAQHLPMLPIVLPFLTITSNQEYLVNRIKELAKDNYLGEFNSNNRTFYMEGRNGHLPTDTAIIFHLFCTYMDTQLFSIPQDSGRPFYSRFVIISENKYNVTLSTINNTSKCAILCSNLINPTLNFISNDRIHRCTNDRNNLFYVIIHFLKYMKDSHYGLIEGVNLGRSGINILCIFND